MLEKKQIEILAPVVRFHPEETCFPMDPMEFIRLSRLRHHVKKGPDNGFNKITGRFEKSDKHGKDYYDIPVASINFYNQVQPGTNRRPKDANSKGQALFLQPRQNLKGIARPNGKAPVFYYQRSFGPLTLPTLSARTTAATTIDYDLVSYWWFMGYNITPKVAKVIGGNHQGDWEHVTLLIRSNELVGCFFSAHEHPPRFVAADRLAKAGANKRVVVYCARGTHASYATPGDYKLPLGLKDRARGGGVAWNVSRLLKKLDDQPWKDYAGAWGEVGEFAWTTGPLGPWYKRDTL